MEALEVPVNNLNAERIYREGRGALKGEVLKILQDFDGKDIQEIRNKIYKL